MGDGRRRRMLWSLSLSLALHGLLLLLALAHRTEDTGSVQEMVAAELVLGPGGATLPLSIAGATAEATRLPEAADSETAAPPEAAPSEASRARPPRRASRRTASGTGADASEGGGRGEGDGLGDPGGRAVAPSEPPPERCGDPVVGVWEGQRFDPADRQWSRMTLRIARTGDALSGTIESRMWRGRREEPTPGPCTAFGEDRTWRMEAHGAADERALRFEGGAARMVREDCPAGPFRYFPDRFTATVRPEGDVMDARNDDGHVARGERYTLRRIACR